MITKKTGAAPPSPVTEKVRDAYERGAPAAWIKRRHSLLQSEYEDMTGDTGPVTTDANRTSGY